MEETGDIPDEDEEDPEDLGVPKLTRLVRGRESELSGNVVACRVEGLGFRNFTMDNQHGKENGK